MCTLTQIAYMSRTETLQWVKVGTTGEEKCTEAKKTLQTNLNDGEPVKMITAIVCSQFT